MTERDLILGIGNIYLETNFLGLRTGGSDSLKEGLEYQGESHETKLGGSVVNFVLQSKMLGSRVGLIGKRGLDRDGETLVEFLKDAGISTELIAASDQVQTSRDFGIVLEHNGKNIQFVAGAANKTLSLSDINFNHPIWNEVAAVYLGGFLKQEALYQDYPRIVEHLAHQGIQIFLDHGRIPVDVRDDQLEALKKTLRFVTGYLPNEHELLGITGKNTIQGGLEEALKFGPQFVVAKLGEDGCFAKNADEEVRVPGLAIKPISTVGAGDSFNAGFITRYLSGSSLRESAEFGNATAALKVSNNQYPSLEEVKEILSKN